MKVGMKENRKMECPVLLISVSLMLTWVQVMCKNSDDCPLIYQRYNTSHSYCQPKNSSCNILQSNMNQEEVDLVLQLHNSYRSIIASQKKLSNGLPAAADMLSMEWDSELAAIAQRHSEQCVLGHDHKNQRRVLNFAVGQNIASSNFSSYMQTNWTWAIEGFFVEIVNFSKEMICGSRKHPPGEIGHFSQLIWSSSFKVGCGYTLFKDGDIYRNIYVCNYGPAGNIDDVCLYKQGLACSKCPINTQCTTDFQTPGLCKRINDETPHLPITVPNIFNCNFINPTSEDCKTYAIGGSWNVKTALGGNFMEIVLQPGQSGTLVFSKRFTPSPGVQKMCFKLWFRKGPNLAKDPPSNEANVLFFTSAEGKQFEIKKVDEEYRQDFSPYVLRAVKFNTTTEMKISFEVPIGATPQFFNLKAAMVFDNTCPDV